MLTMQAEKSASRQMFGIKKTSNTGENIFEIGDVIKWNLFWKSNIESRFEKF